VPGSVVVLPVVAGGVAMVPEVPVVPAALLPIVSVLVPVVPVLLVPMLSVVPAVPVDVPLAVALVSVLPIDEVAVAGGVSVVVVLLQAQCHHAAQKYACVLLFHGELLPFSGPLSCIRDKMHTIGRVRECM
jgi:hypothetical protein